MPLKTLNDKFLHELGDIYDAEHRFIEAQQEMMKQASDSSLKKLLDEHTGETEQQIKNLEQIFDILGEKPKREKCDAATGLVSEGQKGMKEAKDVAEIRDCLINGSAAKVEHYEIASYRGLIEGAEQMQQKEIVRLLKDNLKQEEAQAKQVEGATKTLLQKALKTEEKSQEAGR